MFDGIAKFSSTWYGYDTPCVWGSLFGCLKGLLPCCFGWHGFVWELAFSLEVFAKDSSLARPKPDAIFGLAWHLGGYGSVLEVRGARLIKLLGKCAYVAELYGWSDKVCTNMLLDHIDGCESFFQTRVDFILKVWFVEFEFHLNFGSW